MVYTTKNKKNNNRGEQSPLFIDKEGILSYFLRGGAIYILTFFMFIVFSVNNDSHNDLKRMKSMFEEALLHHPNHTTEVPAGFFYANFETFSPFWRILEDKYISDNGYKNEDEFKEKDYCGYRLWRNLSYASEVIIGEIISEHEDTIFNEIYNKECSLGKEFIIRVDTIFLGNIKQGDLIRVRSLGGKDLYMSSYSLDYPYMSGDTVLVFLRHFPSIFCRREMDKHKNDIGYRMPFYEVRSMFWVSTKYFKEDKNTGELYVEKGPIHVEFHTKIKSHSKQFDYPFSEVKEKLHKFISCGKEYQKRWYDYVNPSIMDSLLLKEFNRNRIKEIIKHK